MPLDQFDIDKDELPEEYRNKLPKREENTDMTFIEHLDVFRKHLMRSALVTVIVAILVAFNISFFLDDLLLAPTKQSFITFQKLCDLGKEFNIAQLCLTIPEDGFINNELGGQFTMHVNSSFTLAIILSFPFIVFQLWQFIKPGLKQNEQKATVGVVLACSTLFFIGISFAYYLVIPMVYQFLISYDITNGGIKNYITIKSYISAFIDLILAFGIMFQLPMVVYILTKIGILTPQLLINYRKHAFVGILILSSILTPPDVLSMTLLAFPLILLYEVSIFISKVYQKKEVQ